MEEEGEAINPVSGEIEPNFAGLEEERKKKLRNQVIIWGAVTIGIIIVVAIIIILILNGGSKSEDPDKSDKSSDEEEDEPVSGEVWGNITCIYDINEGEINIVSEEFEKNFDVVVYIGREKKKYSKKFNFALEDPKTVRFEIHSPEISLKNMFREVDHLKSVYFTTSKEGCKITMSLFS